MNIFKNKKLIATSLAFVLVMTLAGLPLAAKERRGSMVIVTMTDGSKVKGELLAVKTDVLLVYDQHVSHGMSIDLQQVGKVKLLKKSNLGRGLLIGLGVGVGMSVIISSKKAEYPLVLTCIGIGSQTVLIGGIYGALASMPVKFPLAGESFECVRQNLDRLKRYAREQDFEKPAGPQ